MEDLSYLHYLNLLPELGVQSLWKLKKAFGQFEKAVYANYSELLRAGLSNKVATVMLIHCRESFLKQKIEREMDVLRKMKIRIYGYDSINYPTLLSHIAVPPIIIYCRGDIAKLNNRISIAIVGSRKATSYGITVTEKIVRQLCSAGINIVSGLAFGIDVSAHKAALSCNGLTTAVAAGGVDDHSIYPQSHQTTAKQIMENGCIISERPHKSVTMPFSFLARNRIIAGLCRGVVVVECASRSGALMTARYAREENRNIYAVPGSVFNKQSQGPHELISQGAILINSAEDILKDMNIISSPVETNEQKLTQLEKLVLQYINSEPKTLEEISIRIETEHSLGTKTFISLLTGLELKNLINRDSSGKYFLI